jgi:hypothetical protein
MSNPVEDLYLHEPLSSTTSTRLIRLEASAVTDDPIRFYLEEVDLRRPTFYEALSYTWDADTTTNIVFCHGLQMRITSNCEAALRKLRPRSGSRTLWIDAICINQTSIAEKNQQVPLMGEIYRKASQVIVWIGRGSPQTDAALDYLSTVAELSKLPANEHVRNCLADARETLQGIPVLSISVTVVDGVSFSRELCFLWTERSAPQCQR